MEKLPSGLANGRTSLLMDSPNIVASECFLESQLFHSWGEDFTSGASDAGYLKSRGIYEFPWKFPVHNRSFLWRTWYSYM